VFGFKIAKPKETTEDEDSSGEGANESFYNPQDTFEKAKINLPLEPVHTGEEDEKHIFQVKNIWICIISL
jgi:hypothetical protein